MLYCTKNAIFMQYNKKHVNDHPSPTLPTCCLNLHVVYAVSNFDTLPLVSNSAIVCMLCILYSIPALRLFPRIKR
jgi:hypothetical protein